MRIALVSDIHGNLPALQAVLADVARRGAGRIVNLGDHLSGPLWPVETADFLMRQNWLQLAGNHERNLLSRDRAVMELSDVHAAACIGEDIYAWMSGLRDTARDGELLFCHGTPGSDSTYFFESVTETGARLAHSNEIAQRLGDTDAGVVACGHTHMPRALRDAKGRLLVNPGSVGLPAYRDSCPFEHVIETGSTDARYAMIDKVGKTWRASLHAVDYDFESAARQAAANGRPDWVHALRTGYALPAGS